MLSRRDLLRCVMVVPIAGLVRLPELPYISAIVNNPPDGKFYGCLRVVSSVVRKRGGGYCTLIEHQTWEYLYPEGKQDEMYYGIKSFLLNKDWFAKKLHDTAEFRGLEYVPEFSWLNNPVKLKLCTIEHCNVDEKSGRLLG